MNSNDYDDYAFGSKKEELKNKIEMLKSQNESKDEYIIKLEEKIVMMQKYIQQLEKENATKDELGRSIIKTKEEFDKLKVALGEKYLKLEQKYKRLKSKSKNCSNNYNDKHNQTDFANTKINHSNINTETRATKVNNTKIDKCIEKINNVSAKLN